MSNSRLIFNPPPGWPKPPSSWQPPKGWEPDPSWPPAPPGWKLWIEDGVEEPVLSSSESRVPSNIPTNSKDDTKEDVERKDRKILKLEREIAALRQQLATNSNSTNTDVVDLDDERILQEVGIYRYHHPLETAAAYKDKLDFLNGRIVETVKAGDAIQMSNLFTFDNSLAKGRRMTNDLSKLMLRAYNAEVDNCLRTLRVGNVKTAKKRIESSRTAIAKLGNMMEMRISDVYHSLRLEELELTADYLMKKQEEREEAREARARLREERKVQKELAAERERLDKERAHLLNALQALQASGRTDPELESKLIELDDALAKNDFRAANIRAGYVYVISNRGAFGENVVKIGLTRRLEPEERISELSGASVPFRFDIHALFFTEDAVSLETELHQYFAERRVNHANNRKEFFFASPAEVRNVLRSKVGNLLEFTEYAEATEFFQSCGYWPTHQRARIGTNNEV